MYKMLLPLVAAGVLVFASFKKVPQLSVTLNGFTNDTLIISHFALADGPDLLNDSDPRIQWDTLAARNGILTLTPAERPSRYLIIPRQSPRESLKLIVSPHDRVSVRMDYKEGAVTYTTGGSPIADAVNEYNAAVGPVTAQLRRARTTGHTPQATLDSLFDIQAEKTRLWVKDHLDNPAIELYFRLMQPDTVVKYYNLVSPAVRASEVGPLLEKTYRKACQYIQIQQARKTVSEGAAAPDFTLPDKDGKDFTLSTLRGQWVVLDFWGTWCGWCIKGIPDMKKAQARLAGKCRFVSIACRDRRKDWLAALQRYAMPWTQLIVPDKHPTELSPVTRYAVEAYPTKIIIAPDGTIAKITVGESPEFYQALDKLVK